MVTAKQKKAMLKRYEKNEEINNHTENAVMLIRAFGTKAELKKAQYIKKKRDSYEGLSYEDSQWLYEHGHVHYHKLRK